MHPRPSALSKKMRQPWASTFSSTVADESAMFEFRAARRASRSSIEYLPYYCLDEPRIMPLARNGIEM